MKVRRMKNKLFIRKLRFCLWTSRQTVVFVSLFTLTSLHVPRRYGDMVKMIVYLAVKHAQSRIQRKWNKSPFHDKCVSGIHCMCKVFNTIIWGIRALKAAALGLCYCNSASSCVIINWLSVFFSMTRCVSWRTLKVTSVVSPLDVLVVYRDISSGSLW